ncbi:MAG: cytochrome c [Cytophagales bacterium]|nr:cytochrome c [Cytophagales bacterium]
MYYYIYYCHKFSVILFLTWYVLKTFLLLTNREEILSNLTRVCKVPEMIISFLFLGSGIFMMFQYPLMGGIFYIKLAAVFVSIPLAVVAFKKKNKYLASASLLLLFVAYGMAEINKNTLNRNFKVIATNNETATDADLGKTVYTKGCAMCHGEGGNAAIAGAADLSISTISDEQIKQILQNGKNSMPKFNNLTNEQMDAVVLYIKTIRK